MAALLHPMARNADSDQARPSALKSWEYPKKSGIRIREILNLHGGDAFGGSFQVIAPAKITGGLRERKQFKTKTEAEEHAEKVFSGYKKQGHDFFDLSDEERRQVAVCLPLLRQQGITLREAVDFAIKRFSVAGRGKTAREVVAELVQSKEQRFQRGDLRERSYRDFRHRAEKFAKGFEKRVAAEITGQQIKDWLNAQKLGPRTNKNYIAIIGECFRYAVQKRYLALSPLDDLTDVDRKELCGNGGDEIEPSILTIEQAEKLLTAARNNRDLGLLAAVTLGLFCGLRSEELKRLDWANVRHTDAQPVVTIGAKIAKKRRIRHVDIPKNAVQWLVFCAKTEGPVAENNHTNDFQKRFRKLQKLAGFGHDDEKGEWVSTWKNNAMRHSFGSYHYALHGNPLETSRLLGHKASDQVLFDHYRALATKAQAEKYFAICPPPQKQGDATISTG